MPTTPFPSPTCCPSAGGDGPPTPGRGGGGAGGGGGGRARGGGGEPFDTTAGGEPVNEPPEPGEIVWRDDAGVTCRRWNWRQGRRTQLTDSTTRAFFVFDRLPGLDEGRLGGAASHLESLLKGRWSGCETRRIRLDRDDPRS